MSNLQSCLWFAEKYKAEHEHLNGQEIQFISQNHHVLMLELTANKNSFLIAVLHLKVFTFIWMQVIPSITDIIHLP